VAPLVPAPRYSVGVTPEMEQRYAAVTKPITCFSFTDDELLSRRNIDPPDGFYRGAAKTLHHLSPAELGREKIGHMGFFRREVEDLLWRSRLLPEVADV
jgi:predicted alpha/beta hydrolase